MNQITGRIVKLDRLTNSPNGNPRYRVHLDSGPVRETRPDAAVNYGITNAGPGSSGEGREVTLTVDERGHVIGAKYADGGDI